MKKILVALLTCQNGVINAYNSVRPSVPNTIKDLDLYEICLSVMEVVSGSTSWYTFANETRPNLVALCQQSGYNNVINSLVEELEANPKFNNLVLE